MKNQKQPFLTFFIRCTTVICTVTWKWFSPTSQTYRGYYMHNFFSIKICIWKIHLHRNKQSFQKKIHLSHLYRGTLYFIVSPIFYIQNNTYQNNAHHNKHSLSKQSPHFGHITHYTLHITKDKSPMALTTISVGILNIFKTIRLDLT